MAIDIVPVSQRARANGFMSGSKIMGIAASLAWVAGVAEINAADLLGKVPQLHKRNHSSQN